MSNEGEGEELTQLTTRVRSTQGDRREVAVLGEAESQLVSQGKERAAQMCTRVCASECVNAQRLSPQTAGREGGKDREEPAGVKSGASGLAAEQ